MQFIILGKKLNISLRRSSLPIVVTCLVFASYEYQLTTDKNDALEIAMLHASSWRYAYRDVLSAAYLDGDVEKERHRHLLKRLEFPVAEQRILLAKEDNKLLGFACAYLDQDGEWGSSLDNLHVYQLSQRKGIGTGLMREVAKICLSEAGDKRLYLWVLETNRNAQRVYESLGAVKSDDNEWIAPDGRSVPKLRYTWDDLNGLVHRQKRYESQI